MQICNIEPFVRKVTNVRLSETTHYDVYNELRASDCRLFYSVNGSGSIVTEGHVWDMKPRCAVLVSAGSRYVWQPAAGEPMQFISVNFDYTQNFCHIRKSFHPVHADDFPDDAVLCLRRVPTMSAFTGREKAEKKHEFHRDLFRRILEFEYPEGYTEPAETEA